MNIDGRYFQFPASDFDDPPGMEHVGARGIEAGVNWCETNVTRLFEQSGLAPADISLLVSVTLMPAVPTIEARLMNRIPFRRDVKRMPLAGLGCMAGVAALNRATEYLDGHPDQAAIVMSCELSSALWQGSVQADLAGMINKLAEQPELHTEVVMAIVTAALFGDGSGAALLVGREHPLAEGNSLQILDCQSNWVPDTEHIMGLDLLDSGFRNILRNEVKSFVGVGVRQVLQPLLDRYRMSSTDVGHWLIHPGGPKIMDAVERTFDLPAHHMQFSRDTLRQIGNVSSATILHMLDETFKANRPVEGTPGLLVAMGPGFSQESALLQW